MSLEGCFISSNFIHWASHTLTVTFEDDKKINIRYDTIGIILSLPNVQRAHEKGQR